MKKTSWFQRVTSLCGIRTWMLAAGVVMLAGCNAVQMGYPHLPSLLAYRANTYLSLSNEQQAALRQAAESLLLQHRREALPVYAETLREWVQVLDTQQAVSAEWVFAEQQRVQAELQTLGQQAAVAFGPLLVGLQTEQHTRLARRFDRDNRREVAEREADPEHRLKEVSERIARWTGPLRADQVALLADWRAQRGDLGDLWQQEREARQRAVLDLLQQVSGADPNAGVVGLQEYFESLASRRVPELSLRQARDQREWAEVSAALLNSLDAAQRQTLRDRLLGYAEDFEALAGRGRAVEQAAL